MRTVDYQVKSQQLSQKGSFTLFHHRCQASSLRSWVSLLICALLLGVAPLTWAANVSPVHQDELLATIQEFAHAVGKIDLETPKCFKDVVIIHYTPRKIFCDMWGKENGVRVRVS